MVNKKLDYILNHWICFKCGHINDMYKKHRKRKEVQKHCIKCNAEMPKRAI